MDGGFSVEMLNTSDKESVKLIIIGSRDAVGRMIHKMHCLHLAEPNDWSRPQRAKSSDEVITLLIQRV